MGKKKGGQVTYKGKPIFYNARFKEISDRLGKDTGKMFREMSYKKKVRVVQKMLEKGLLKW